MINLEVESLQAKMGKRIFHAAYVVKIILEVLLRLKNIIIAESTFQKLKQRKDSQK